MRHRPVAPCVQFEDEPLHCLSHDEPGQGISFEVPLPDGFPVSGVVLSDHIKSLDWQARKWQFICQGQQEITQEVLARVKALIAIA